MNIASAHFPPPFDQAHFRSRHLDLKRRQELTGGVESRLCWIMGGALQTSVMAEDGRRWISGFHLPGEIVWLNTSMAESLTAQALCTSRVVLTDGLSIDSLPAAGMLPTIWDWLLRSYIATARRGFVLARLNALEKLCYFLLDLRQRMQGRSSFTLLMSRSEIGDHLGITSETVTRTFTSLRRGGLVGVSGPQVEIKDPEALVALARAVIST